jgi:hexosaminidase
MIKAAVTLLFFFFVLGAQAQRGIIPQPQQMTWQKGTFHFDACTYLQFDSSNKELQWAVAPLKEKFKKAAGYNLSKPLHCNKATIVSVTLDNQFAQAEGYQLEVKPDRIEIKAQQPVGVFYAVQSLLQLLPVQIESTQIVKVIKWQVPAVSITDAPRFGYRGFMLDVARHFMSVDSVKRFIDLMARQKANHFHWHLTDSQGWRFESKKYDKLNTIAAYRKGTPLNTTYDYESRPQDTLYGGYYTQQQMREVVQYAAERFITVVPEIEMPAHSRSALAAYPQLACLDSNGKAFLYPQQIQNEYCTKEETFTFLFDVLAELMAVFPSSYIHIAGDEAAKTAWRHCPHDQKRMQEEGLQTVEELQSYFVKRITAFVNSQGRKVIGWDEIMQGGLAPGATVMSWTGIDNGIKAATQAHQVIMTPGAYCYFDHYQSTAHGEPLAWGGLTTLEKVYSYKPVPDELSAEQAKYILGTQANLWTEFVPTAAKAEYMLFPRAIALAEVAWTDPNKKNYSDFRKRLIPYLRRLDAYGVNYARHLYDLQLKDSVTADGTILIQLSAEDKLPVYYTLDGSMPNRNSQLYKSPVPIKKSAQLNAAIIVGGMVVAQLQRDFNLHKLVGKKATLATAPAKQYSKGGADAWHNGSPGSKERFDDDEWLGWNATPFNATINLGSSETISQLHTRFFHKPSSWIWVPKSIEVQVSDDGMHFKTVAAKNIELPNGEGSVNVQLAWKPVKADWMRITATPYGTIPAGQTGAGFGAWLFVDEMKVD